MDSSALEESSISDSLSLLVERLSSSLWLEPFFDSSSAESCEEIVFDSLESESELLEESEFEELL